MLTIDLKRFPERNEAMPNSDSDGNGATTATMTMVTMTMMLAVVMQALNRATMPHIEEIGMRTTITQQMHNQIVEILSMSMGYSMNIVEGMRHHLSSPC